MAAGLQKECLISILLKPVLCDMDLLHQTRIDPRTSIILLVLSNVIAFSQDLFWLQTGYIIFLALLLVLCGCLWSAVKWVVGYFAIVCLQTYILPYSIELIATSFSIFIYYARRMFPCLMVGMLMIKKTPLRHLIIAFRKLHLPEKLIIAISITMRYFPAIKEETGYIRDAMKLRNIRGFEKVECMVVPIMISASNTAEELSAAAVTRGIENPVPKTSILELKMSIMDWLCITIACGFTVAGFMLK